MSQPEAGRFRLIFFANTKRNIKTYIAAAAFFAAGTICANALGGADGSFFGEFYAENADFEYSGDTDLDEISGKEWVSDCAGFSFTLESVVDGFWGDSVSDPYFSLGAITFAHGGFSGDGEVYLNVYTSPTPRAETFLGQSSELAAEKPGSGELAFESVNFRNDDKASDIILKTEQTYYVFFSSTLINGDYVFESVDGTLVLSKSEDVRGDDVAYAGTNGSAAGDGARPIYSVSLDAASLPEPSAFGLLAGTCALAFAASRRGRKS